MKKDSVKTRQTKPFSAKTMRGVLAFLLVLIIVGAGAGFYFGLDIVRSYSVEVSHANADATASATNVQDLDQLKTQLANTQTLVSKADQLFSTPDTYQTQALKDISKYATESGVVISSIDSANTSTTDTNTSTTTPAAGSNYSEIVTIQSPVSYANFLKFLDAIEGNLPKMQITGISIGRPADGTPGEITTDKITITVAVRWPSFTKKKSTSRLPTSAQSSNQS